MATYATSLANGKTNPQGLLRIFTKVFPDSGVLESSALTVSAQTSPDMTVKVSGSSLNDNAIFKTSSGHFIQAWNDADLNVTIAPNSSGSAKTDAIVLWVDLTDGDASNANNPGALRVSAIRGSSGAPNSGEITAVTGSNPYFVRANIAVANGVGVTPGTSINSGNITNLSPLSRIDGALIKASSIVFGALANESVANANLKTGAGEPGGAWTAYTPTFTSSGGGASLGNGTVTGAYKRVGNTVFVNASVNFGSTSTYGSGSLRLSLPIPPTTMQTYGIARVYRGGGGSHSVALAINYSGNQWCDFWADGATGNVTGTSPFSFGSSTGIIMQIFYEAAP